MEKYCIFKELKHFENFSRLQLKFKEALTLFGAKPECPWTPQIAVWQHRLLLWATWCHGQWKNGSPSYQGNTDHYCLHLQLAPFGTLISTDSIDRTETWLVGVFGTEGEAENVCSINSIPTSWSSLVSWWPLWIFPWYREDVWMTRN